MRRLQLEISRPVLERRLPELHTLSYEGRGVKSLVENRLYEHGPEQTRWVMNNVLQFSP